MADRTVTVHAPNRDFRGRVGAVQFRAGVAEVDRLAHARELAYFTRRGYGIGGPPPEVHPMGQDARDVTTVTVGTPLRDAAVDPAPTDFLPPTNAGQADPHGPLVVAPQVHASETGPIRGGEVFVDDPARQQAAETALDERVFVEGEPATIASETAPSDATDAPARSATKAAWVDFAVSRGIARDEAEDLTKAEIQDRLG